MLRRLLMDRRGLALPGELVLRVVSFGSGALATNCLLYVSLTFRDRPVLYTLEDVQAYASQFVNIRVVDLCKESNFGRRHRVVVWQK